MASAIIHIAIAHEANKILNMNEKELILGSIAPDIAKRVGMKRNDTHFADSSCSIHLDEFLLKYQDSLDNSFNLGYYCHLFTDLLWYGFYSLKYQIGNNLYYKDGHIEELSPTKITEIIYQEYTNLNIKIIDKYDLDLSLFYEETPIIKSNIKEMPLDKINILIEQMGIIIENSTDEPNYIFDLNSIEDFIDFATNAFINHLKEIRVL